MSLANSATPLPTHSTANGNDTFNGILPEIQRLRWQNTLAVLCFNPIIALYFGMSPLVPLMNAMTEDVWLAPGVTQPALMSVFANVVVLQFAGGIVRNLTPLGTWLAAMTSLASPVLIGVSAWSGIVWIQYIGAILGAFGYATTLSFRTLALQWWSLDGRIATGEALVSFATGLEIVGFALGTAWLCAALGLATATFVLAAIMLILGLFPLWLALKGKLGGPNIISTAGMHAANAAPELQDELSHEIKLWSFRKYWHLWVHSAVFPFVGFSMKALTTSIFDIVYGTSYLDSSYLTALSLCLFVVVRGSAPLLTQELPVISVSMGLLMLNLVCYALYPTIIANTSVWVLLTAQTVAGASFAAILSVQPLVMVHLYGAANLPRVFASLGSASAFGYGLGPLVGHYIQVISMRRGLSSQHAFDPFFYLCAIVAGLGVFNLLALSMLNEKEESVALKADPEKHTRLKAVSSSPTTRRATTPTKPGARDPITQLVGQKMVTNFGLTSEEAIQHFREWKPRESDIVITTFPKTGTTWIQQITEMLRCDRAGMSEAESTAFKGIEQVQPLMVYAYDVGQDLGDEQRGGLQPRLFKNHVPLNAMPGRFNDDIDCKYIVTVRDPATTLVSWYNFQQQKGENDETKFFLGAGADRCQSADEMLAFSGMPVIHGNGIWQTFLEFYKCRHQPNVLLLAFEDLNARPQMCVKRIAAFMGVLCDDARTERVLARSTKEFMGSSSHASKFDESWVREEQIRHARTPVLINPAVRITKGARSTDLMPQTHRIMKMEWQKAITGETGLQTYQDMLSQLQREADVEMESLKNMEALAVP